MNGIAFFLLTLMFQNSCCSFAGLFEEWAKVKKEPEYGSGLYKVEPIFLGTCEPAHKRDPNVWINATIKYYKVKGDYNADIDLYYPENVTLNKIHWEMWGKTANEAAIKIFELTITKPCKYYMFSLMLRVLNIYPPCTILKGHYRFTYEKGTKIMTKIRKHLSYMRYIYKLEYFSDKGEFGCNLGIGDALPIVIN